MNRRRHWKLHEAAFLRLARRHGYRPPRDGEQPTHAMREDSDIVPVAELTERDRDARRHLWMLRRAS